MLALPPPPIGRRTFLRTEALAGLTTFLTMAYIIVVNPLILADAGLPIAATATATCLACAFGSILMGAACDLPLALAPGMGLNAYFTYTVVKGMGLPWPTAMGCVFLSAAGMLVLTLVGARRVLLAAMPPSLLAATGGGIGLFIAFIGLKQVGIVAYSPATLVTLGKVWTPQVGAAALGLVVTAWLQARRAPVAILCGVAAAAIVGGLTAGAHLTAYAPGTGGSVWATAFRLDMAPVFHLRRGVAGGLLEVVFVFLFVELFDNLGTLSAVTGSLGPEDGSGLPSLRCVLVVDALAAMFGAVLGVTTVTTYVESASGVAAGGRTGLTSITVGLLFLAAAPFARHVGALPAAATTPALIVVGVMMMSPITRVDWTRPDIAIPAFLTLLIIPLTFSIANGVAIGVIAHAALRLASGRPGRRDIPLLVLAALCLARFVYLANA